MNNHEIHEKGQFLVYETEDGQIKIDVRLEDETVWLTQRLMAELFQKDVRTINHHIQSIYEEGELEPTPTIRKYRIVQTEGKRQVSRIVDFYNLDMIISVGYRVKSHVATRFRIWATGRLKEYIIKERLRVKSALGSCTGKLFRTAPMIYAFLDTNSSILVIKKQIFGQAFSKSY